MARVHAWGWGGRGQPPSALEPLAAGCSWLSLRLTHRQFGRNRRLRDLSDAWAGRDGAAFLGDPAAVAMLWDFRAGAARLGLYPMVTLEKQLPKVIGNLV